MARCAAAPLRAAFFAFFLVALSAAYCSAGENIILYRVGERDNAQWSVIRKYLQAKGYRAITYDASAAIEKQVENANRINRERASLCIAMSIMEGPTESALVAVTDAAQPAGRIAAVEEVPASHRGESRAAATALAASFRTTVKTLPLFPLVGIDMPGVFLRLEYTKEGFQGLLDMLGEGLIKYYGKGVQNEG